MSIIPYGHINSDTHPLVLYYARHPVRFQSLALSDAILPAQQEMQAPQHLIVPPGVIVRLL